MRNDRMGRHRKKLEDKSTTLMFRMDNKTLFLLCDKFNISYNRDAGMVEDTTKKLIIAELEEIIRKVVK